MRTRWWWLLAAAALVGCDGGGDDPAVGPGEPDAAGGDAVDTSAGDTLAGDTEDPHGTGDTEGDTTDAVELVGEWRADELGLGEEFVLRGAWGTSPDQLVAVGNKATIIEYDGEGWQLVHQNTELDTLNAVWGAAPDDVWAVGAHGAILHKGASGWNIGSGCSNDAACDDGDPCTVDSCGTDGECVYEGSGAAGCCGSAAFTTDFEAGIGSWTVADTSATQAGMVWHAAENQGPGGEARATSGTTALYFGDPSAPCADDPGQLCPSFDAAGAIVAATATTPAFQVPAAGAVTATFQVFIDAESSSSFDQLRLDVVDSGLASEVWTKQDAGGATSGQFVPATADLTAWAGKEIQLRFEFNSVDGSINDGEGVYIDDLRVDTTCGTVTQARFPTLWSVWGTASDDVFAVGNEGTILHWDGQSWKRQLGGASSDLFAVGGNADELVAAGGGGEVVSTFGGGLSSDKADTGSTLRGVAVQPDGTSVAVGDGGAISVYDGAAWTAQPSPVSANLRGAWTDGTTVVAVGEGGTIVTGAPGGAWTQMESPMDDPLNAVWGPSDSDLWAVGDKVGVQTVLVRYDGVEWQSENLSKINAELRSIHGVDGPGGQLIVAVGGGGAIAENVDGVWSKAPVVTTFTLHGVWGASTDRLFAVGNQGVILERAGGEWTEVESPTSSTLYAIWGRAADDVYAVGAQGNVVRWDGAQWTVLRSSTTAALRGVWGLGPDRVYAVGSDATIMQFNGLYWSQIKVEDEVQGEDLVPVTDQLLDVWGRAPDDIYAVGANGAIVHTETDPLTGTMTWVKIPQEVTVTHRGIWGDTQDGLWLVGRTGNVHSFRGVLEPEDSGTIATLYDVLGFEDGPLIAVGDLGTVVRRHLVPASR